MQEHRLIGEILLEHEAITPTELTKALNAQGRNGSLLGEVLVGQGVCSQEQIIRALGEQLGLPCVRPSTRDVDEEAVRKLPAEMAFRLQVAPLSIDDGCMTVAMSNPLDLNAIEELRLVAGCEIRPVLATADDIRRLVDDHYMQRMMADATEEDVRVLEEAEDDIGDLARMATEAVVVKWVNMLLRQALQARASDVHIEPFERGLRVRYRIDGVLHEVPAPPKRLQAAIVSRVKIMADLDIAERRLPQDGRIKISVSGAEVDLRVSTVPTVYGESVVMRILEQSSIVLDMEELGMDAESRAVLEKLIRLPHGIVLVTGPTGSGKTTTLYAALRKTYSTEKKILTIEDPVEYRLEGINQIQVRPQIGLTFATGLRHILRQDPDVIMVGEVRDRETAEIAIHSALTGHLVFSTLHTNDAAGALTRLLEMGVEPFLAASTVEGVLAQRLVRVLCPECSRDSGEAHGCDECRFTGYRGRTGIYEMLTVDDDIRDLILQHAPASQITQTAIEHGMRTLVQDGLLKVEHKITTMSEVIRVTREEEGPLDAHPELAAMVDPAAAPADPGGPMT